MRTGRTTAVLERFPCHIGATDPGKRFESVVEAIVSQLDVVGRQIGDVRRAHRIIEAPTDHDLGRLVALHDIRRSSFVCSDVRLNALAATAEDDLAHLAALLGVEPVQLEDVPSDALSEAILSVTRFTNRLDVRRRSAAGIIGAFRTGNGTAEALLRATASYLALDLVDVGHSADRWWHLGKCQELLSIDVEGVDTGDALLAIEENPFEDASVAPIDRRHADRFRIVRGGLEDVTVTTDVVGVGERTVHPMVVNVDVGRGVVFDGTVPDGVTLSFEANGRVMLGDSESTGSCFAFDGAVFASSDALHPKDFVYADAEDPGESDASFVVTAPVADAFGTSTALSHSGGTVDALTMPLGESRWAFFVRVAHFGSGTRAAVPSYGAGQFDGSVWADDDGGLDEVSGSVGFRWQEREPFALRVLLPQRYAALDDDAGSVLLEPLRLLLDRHRAAGVHVYVAYADDRWVLGTGVVRDNDSDDAVGTLVSGTTLWTSIEQ
jgi:hypothetical protein